MKRKTVLLFAVCFFTVFAALWAGGGQSASKSGQTLKWAMWDADLTLYYKDLIAAWNAKHPDVKIELVDLGSADFMTLLSTQLSGGADFDVVSIKEIPGYVNLIKQGRLEPLNAFISSSPVDTSLYGGIIDQLKMNGEVYTLPFRTDHYLIYYNKDVFDKAGVPYPSNDLTYDQYDALARKVTTGSGANKVYGGHYHTWSSQVQLFGILDGKNTLTQGTYDFLAPHYNRVLKAQDDGVVQAYATLKTSGTHYSGVFFNNQIAMMHQGTWFIGTQIEKVRTGESLSKNWGLAKYPHPDGVPAGTSPRSITGISVNKNSKNKQVALEFMKFVSGPEGALVLAKTGTIPAILSDDVVKTISSLPGFPTDANSKAALSVTKTYLEMPINEKLSDINTVLNETHDAIMTKNISVADGVKQMNDRVGKILGR